MVGISLTVMVTSIHYLSLEKEVYIVPKYMYQYLIDYDHSSFLRSPQGNVTV